MVSWVKKEKVHVDRSYGKPILVRSSNQDPKKIKKQEEKQRKKEKKKIFDQKIREYKQREAEKKAKYRAKKLKARQQTMKAIKAGISESKNVSKASMGGSSSKKKTSKPKGKSKYVIKGGVAYPIAKSRVKSKQKKDNVSFSWDDFKMPDMKEFRMPKMKDLFK